MLGGAELCLKDIVCFRKNEGDRVVLFQDGPLVDVLRGEGVETMVEAMGSRGSRIRKESGLLSKASATLGLMGLAKRVASLSRDVDVIYANTAKALVVSVIAGRLSRRPVVYHLHDILSAAHFSKSNLYLLSALAKHGTAHVIANSHATMQSLLDLGGRPESISVVYNGIDPAPFDAAIEASDLDRPAIRKAFGISPDAAVLGLFGRFAQWKGQHVAIEAVRRLPETHLFLVGEALFGEEAYAAELRSVVDKYGLEDRVHFLGFRRDIATVMRACDVVIHCSTSPEPFGRVIAEAMLARRPVIAAAGGGAMEIIQDSVTGRLHKPGCVESLTETVKATLESESSAETMVQEAFRSARRRFDLQSRVDEVTAVIEAIGKRGSETL